MRSGLRIWRNVLCRATTLMMNATDNDMTTNGSTLSPGDSSVYSPGDWSASFDKEVPRVSHTQHCACAATCASSPSASGPCICNFVLSVCCRASSQKCAGATGRSWGAWSRIARGSCCGVGRRRLFVNGLSVRLLVHFKSRRARRSGCVLSLCPCTVFMRYKAPCPRVTCSWLFLVCFVPPDTRFVVFSVVMRRPLAHHFVPIPCVAQYRLGNMDRTHHDV